MMLRALALSLGGRRFHSDSVRIVPKILKMVRAASMFDAQHITWRENTHHKDGNSGTQSAPGSYITLPKVSGCVCLKLLAVVSCICLYMCTLYVLLLAYGSLAAGQLSFYWGATMPLTLCPYTSAPLLISPISKRWQAESTPPGVNAAANGSPTQDPKIPSQPP